MDRTTVIRTDNDVAVSADILNRSDRRLEVVLAGSDLKLVLTKNTPHQRVYVGNAGGMEFTSTGD